MKEEEKIIKELADPIIEQIKSMKEEDLKKYWNHIPSIRFVVENQTNQPVKIDGVEITDDFIKKLEAYVQEELEMINMPTILH